MIQINQIKIIQWIITISPVSYTHLDVYKRQIDGNKVAPKVIEVDNATDTSNVIVDINQNFVQRENAAIRLRLVEGYEFAGGFTGKLENANAADTGNLNVLYGLIKLNNPIQALGAVYPTETNTAT